jgi:DNA-binding NarL/FixJ family response regulator
VFAVQSGSETVKKSIVVQVVNKPAKPMPSKPPLQVVLATTGNNSKEIERGLSKGMEVVPAAVGEDAWSLTGAPDGHVEVIVVDVDRYGLQLIRDLRLVFPTVRILALTNDPRRLGQAVRAGATIAVPRSTPPKDLAKLIQRLAIRRPY